VPTSASGRPLALPATYVHFDIRVCEGYDPESKGKVEAGVKYVKNDFFYGEEFSSTEEVTDGLRQWLDQVANQRIHGTTGQRPQRLYENQEKKQMKPYLTPNELMPSPKGESRQVDKTGLISFKSNKYSVPMLYQSSQVWVKEEGNRLGIYDFNSEEEIANHPLCTEKGLVLKNTNHYRDYRQEICDHEEAIALVLGGELAQTICVVLKTTSPKIYKDQLLGLIKLLKTYSQKEAINLRRDNNNFRQLEGLFRKEAIEPLQR